MLNVNDYKTIDKVYLDQYKKKYKNGKTRDMYSLNEDNMIIIATDRISSFDKVFGSIPLKGNILHNITKFWFENTKDIIQNHIINADKDNILKVNKFNVYPVEVIVRGYITGTTDTSLWTLYNKGVESPYGLNLPKGLKLNDKLPDPVITPTTKADYGKHDEVLTEEAIISGEFIEESKWEEIKDYDWNRIRSISLELFKRGQELAKEAGLILVDTKYEFGYKSGELYLIDEIHTPDSSRYWLLEDYNKGNINNYDKEFFRKEIRKSGGVITKEISQELISRYIKIYERMSGNTYKAPDYNFHEKLENNIINILKENS